MVQFGPPTCPRPAVWCGDMQTLLLWNIVVRREKRQRRLRDGVKNDEAPAAFVLLHLISDEKRLLLATAAVRHDTEDDGGDDVTRTTKSRNVGVISIRMRSRAQFPKGLVVNGETTQASTKGVRPPPGIPPGTGFAFGLADWGGLLAPRQLSSNKLGRCCCLLAYPHFQRWKTGASREKTDTSITEPRSMHPNGDSKALSRQRWLSVDADR